jgi:hypothetical protein
MPDRLAAGLEAASVSAGPLGPPGGGPGIDGPHDDHAPTRIASTSLAPPLAPVASI